MKKGYNILLQITHYLFHALCTPLRSTCFNHSLPSSFRLPDLHNKVGKSELASGHFAPRMITSNFFPAVSSNMWLRKIITRREIFAPFNCYLDILLALCNYSWISGLPLIEATNLCREGPALEGWGTSPTSNTLPH